MWGDAVRPRVRKQLEQLGQLDLSRLVGAQSEDDPEFLRAMRYQAQARLYKFKPLSVAERLESFRLIGYVPHGLWLPDHAGGREMIRKRLERIGNIESEDVRLKHYKQLQDITAQLEKKGFAGRWTGQQAVARSPSPYRIVAWGRRSGKSFHASREAVGAAVLRPRSTVWLAAPIMRLVSRGFDMAVQLIQDRGWEDRCRALRNSTQEKHIELWNGSIIDGISLENYLSAAGAAVDFAVIDEAAQITPESWHRAIQPPLVDRGGQALLISSFEGEGDFFHAQAMRAQAEKAEYGTKADWDYFQDASYDVNFYAFPKGRQSETIQRAQRHTPPQDFLELFGAIPAGARERVYSEFKERVHVGDYRFDPQRPVRLSIDPSSGINPYAVAVIQDYETHFVIIDEFYERAMTCEEISPVLKRRPWAPNVTDVVVDTGSGEDEIIRWVRMGWPAFGVPEKPRVPDSIPLVRNMLRDPARFYRMYRRKVNDILREMGLPPDEDRNLPPDQQRLIVLQLEEQLNNYSLSEEDVNDLKTCARLYVSQTCVNTITEFKTYSYQKRRQLNLNYKEIPRSYSDHICDAVRYFVWTYYRHEGLSAAEAWSYVSPGEAYTEADLRPLPTPNVGEPPPPPRNGFLTYMRDHYDAVGRMAGVSLLR
jgi:hypothetical protein